MATRTHRLPNRYYVGPDGQTATSPAVEPELLRSPLVRELLGLRPDIEAPSDEVVRTLPAVEAWPLHSHRIAA
jgi:hypothetical protein